MMNIHLKKTATYFVAVMAIFMIVFGLTAPQIASADKYDYGLGGYDYGDDWYYDDTPIYSYYDDYYDDWYYDDTPVYSYYDDYYDYGWDYPDYTAYDYRDYQTYTPSYSTPSYSSSYYPTYTPTVVTPSYTGGSYSTYTPAPYPVYIPTTSGGDNINTNANSSNSNSSSSNVNNNNNVNNNVNNNNVNVVIGTPVSSTYQPPVYYPQYPQYPQYPSNPQYPTYNNLTAYCVANPTSATVGQNIIWTVYPAGGNGSYSYSWTGTDGLSYGNASAIQKTYTYSGTKTATVTVYSAGQTITANCTATVIDNGVAVSNVTVIRQPTVGTPVSGVYLSQVPDTGIEFNIKVALFAVGLLLWSAFLGYVIVSKRKVGATKLAFARTGTAGSDNTRASSQNIASVADRIAQFKLDNLRKKGIK